MLERVIKFERVFREETEAGDPGENDLLIDMAFSSEEPAERWFGTEVLDHSKKSIRLERLNDGANVLENHDPNLLRGTHVPGSVKVGKDRILRGKVRLQGVTDAGRDTQALVEAGHLTKASIGYVVHRLIEENVNEEGEKIIRELDGRAFEGIYKRTLESVGEVRSIFYRDLDKQFGEFERGNGQPSVFKVIDWEPFENSLVTIPLDRHVGVGRNFEKPADNAKTKGETMKEKKDLPNPTAGETADENDLVIKQIEEKGRKTEKADVEKKEQGRIRAIETICRTNKMEDYREIWINQGYTLEEVAQDVEKILFKRSESNPSPASKLGLNDQEVKKFSLSKAILAAASNNWGNAQFELECHRAVQSKMNTTPEERKFYVPFDVLQRPIDQRSMLSVDPSLLLRSQRLTVRDLTVGVGADGGFLRETENVGFIEMLRNRQVAVRMGVRVLSGLVGNVTIPRQSAAATAYWLATEATAVTESQQTFAQVSLSPKNVGAYTEVSRQLLLQSTPGAEGIVNSDLARVLAIEVDRAVLDGSGAAGQPTGIISTAGIGSVVGTSLGYVGVLEFQEDVAGANVTPVRGGYVTTPAVAALMMQRVKFTSTASPLWEGNLWDGNMVGFMAMSSNQMPAANMLFGDWQEAILAEWGVLEVEVNPFANFAAGIIGVRAMYSVDVGVRIPGAFSLATTIT